MEPTPFTQEHLALLKLADVWRLLLELRLGTLKVVIEGDDGFEVTQGPDHITIRLTTTEQTGLMFVGPVPVVAEMVDEFAERMTAKKRMRRAGKKRKETKDKEAHPQTDTKQSGNTLSFEDGSRSGNVDD